MSSRSERSDDIDIDISSDTEVKKITNEKQVILSLMIIMKKYLNANIVRRSIRTKLLKLFGKDITLMNIQ